MLRILHKKIIKSVSDFSRDLFDSVVDFFFKIPNSCTYSGRPSSPGFLRLAATVDRNFKKSGSVTSQFRKFAKNVGFFSKKAEKICENS